VKLSFAQLEGKCYCCGKAGHRSTTCRYKNKPKSEWAINVARNNEKKEEQEHALLSQEEEKEEEKEEQTIQNSWMGAQIILNQTKQVTTKLKDLILLDTCSSKTIFCNRKYVQSIRKSDASLVLKTNAGDFSTTQVAELKEWGTWFNEDSASNIFSFAEKAERYNITYDNNSEDVFVVKMKSKTIKFQKISENIYAFDPTRKKVSLLTTLQENKKSFTKRQFERAKTARDLLHNLGYCSLKDFKAAITMNLIKNCPVTLEDINNSEKIFGADIPSMKGKITRQKPIPVVQDMIDLKMAYQNIIHRG